MPYCPQRRAGSHQVGILGTAVVEILFGLLIMRIGKASLDRRSCRQSSPARWLSSSASRWPAWRRENPLPRDWGVAFDYADVVTIAFLVYRAGERGLLGMLPILLGAIVG